jgi:hypothetical protein
MHSTTHRCYCVGNELQYVYSCDALILSQAPSYCALVGIFNNCKLRSDDFRANEMQSIGHFQGSNYSRNAHAEKD